MEFVAIVERRLLEWHVYLPLLATGGPVPAPNDVQSYATALVTAATGRAPADVQITVQLAVQADTVLRTSPTDVETRHQDGTWRVAQHVGWLRQRDGSWKPLVCYTADGVTWQRAVHAAHLRPRDAEVPAPRTCVEGVRAGRSMPATTLSPA